MAANEANFLGLMCLSPQSSRSFRLYFLHGRQVPPHRLGGGPLRAAFPALPGLCGAARSRLLLPQPPLLAVLAQFTTKAKAIGADAIILCPQPGGPEQTGAVRPAKVDAVAIKYRLENPPEKQGRP